MKTVSIDFAAPSLARTLFRMHPTVWLVSIFGLGLCVAAVLTAVDAAQHQEVRRDEIRRLEARINNGLNAKPPVKKSLITNPQARSINGAIAQLNLPWQDLLDAMEAATPATIALLSLEPDGGKHLLKASAEAKSADEMLGYIELLKQQAFFGSVMLTKHEVNEQDPNKPIRFSFEARWIASE